MYTPPRCVCPGEDVGGVCGRPVDEGVGLFARGVFEEVGLRFRHRSVLFDTFYAGARNHRLAFGVLVEFPVAQQNPACRPEPHSGCCSAPRRCALRTRTGPDSSGNAASEVAGSGFVAEADAVQGVELRRGIARLAV
mgnify:CR=1 FL=1